MVKASAPNVAPLTKPRRPIAMVISSRSGGLYFFFAKSLQGNGGITGQVQARVKWIAAGNGSATTLAGADARQKQMIPA
jgi:hypothetical protein